MRRACLSRHVRLAQVPADYFRVHNANRLDTVAPIMTVTGMSNAAFASCHVGSNLAV